MNLHLRSFILAALLCSGLVSAQDAERKGPLDSAHLARTYSLYQLKGGNVERAPVGKPTLIVTLAHYVDPALVKSGAAFTLHDLGGGNPVKLDFAGEAHTGSDWYYSRDKKKVYGWFLLTAAEGHTLDFGADYELTIHYDEIESWDPSGNEDPDDGGALGKLVTDLGAESVPVELLPPGRRVKDKGGLSDEPDDDASFVTEGVEPAGFLEKLDFQITPLTAEGSNELGLEYKAEYKVDQKRFGAGGTPGNYTLDFVFEGRTSSTPSDNSLTGYSKADLNLRGMWLLGSERYYPLGVRLAAGFEGGDDNSDAESTLTGQLVATLPYLGDVLEGWQETAGFSRPFAPPFVSVGYVESGARVGMDGQNRFEVEAGWILPIAKTWDLNVNWRHLDFTERGIGSKEFMELDLTYYPGGDLSQGLRMSFEDGYRAAVGEIGSTVLIGYTVKL